MVLSRPVPWGLEMLEYKLGFWSVVFVIVFKEVWETLAGMTYMYFPQD